MKILFASVGPDSGDYPFRSHPLGLMYLAAAVKSQYPEIESRIVDLKVSGGPGALEPLLAERYDMAAVSALSVHADELRSAALAIRARQPECMIVAGGPHATCFPEQVLQYADAVVCGEGEKPFTSLARAVLAGEPFDSIAAVFTDPRACGSERSFIQNPDDIPFPAWELIDNTPYERHSSFSILGRRRYMSLFTSRACPYGCVYCHSIFGRGYRPRSAENVVAEIREINARFGIVDFDILDDAFNINRARVVEICELLLAGKTRFELAFPNGLRSDLLDEDLLKLLRQAGTKYISFAIESASPRMQRAINKNLDIARASAAIRVAASLGIFCNGYFMLGFPGESGEEIDTTVRFAVKSPLHTAHFLKVTPFERTPLYEGLPDDMKKVLSEHPGMLRYGDRSFNLSDVPNEEFNAKLRRAMRVFYLNPLRMWRLLAAHPHKWNIPVFVMAALRRMIPGMDRR